MAGFIGCMVVLTATSLLPSPVVTMSCHPKIVTCGCGNTTVDIPIKRCLKITTWGSACKPCTKYRKSRLCAKYQHCFQCDQGGCLKCNKGRYGAFCEKECRCENGGSCNHHGNCQCLPSFIGEHCQTKILKDCGSPIVPVYGDVILTNTTEGSIASFRCPPNFLLIGQVNQTCLPSGQWSGKAPVCEYSCPVPKRSSHLKIQLEPLKHMFDDYVSNIELTRQARFSCDEGYEIKGRQLLNCLPDGTWDSPEPTCVRTCQPPPVVHDGEVIQTNFRFLEGDTVQYRCHDNFRMENPATLTCFNGLWDSKPPRCVPKIQCDELYIDIEKGHITYSDSDRIAGTLATLNCYSGYSKTSTEDNICDQHGFWVGDEFECVEVDAAMICDKPDYEGPENGWFSMTPGSYEYGCEDGYFISGVTQNYCIDGEWIHDVPKCVQKTTCLAVDIVHGCSVCFGNDCSKPGRTTADCFVASSDVVLPEDHFPVGTVMEFRYDRMLYHLSGSLRRVCQSDGVWSGRQPTCIPYCGRQSFKRRIGVEPRIRMGHSTNDGDWPWQVGVFWVHGSGKMFQCGGSLISEDLVLTAAHCVQSSSDVKGKDEIEIHVGAVNLNGKHGKLVKVKEIIVNNGYNHHTLDNDIALIQLREKLKLSTTIRPVCLPGRMDSGDSDINDTGLDDLTGVEGVVVGWGLTENGSHPDILKMTNVKVADQHECFERLSTVNMTDKMLCAVGSNPSQPDACSGDSGGPLLVEDESGRWTVMGIVSFGLYNCSVSTEKRYGYYTRVETFLPWIQKYL